MNRLELMKRACEKALSTGKLSPDRPLRVVQVEAITAYRTFLEEQGDAALRGYFDIATGAGKSGIFAVLNYFADEIAREAGIAHRSLVLVPTEVLMEQALKNLLLPDKGRRKRIGFLGAGHHDTDHPITIAIANSWVTRVQQGQISGADIDHQYSDEGHNYLSDTRIDLLNNELDGCLHVGFTATAEYDPQKTMQLTHGTCIYRLTLRDAVRRGLLAEYIDICQPTYRIPPEAHEKLSPSEKLALKRVVWIKAVVDNLKTRTNRFTGEPLYAIPAIAFTAGTSMADYLHAQLSHDPVIADFARQRGIGNFSTPYHTNQGAGEQRRALALMEQEASMMLIGDKKATEGLDIPRVKLVISYPSASSVRTIQRVGRGTRPYFDPVTQSFMGATVLEPLVYYGERDPDADARARKEAEDSKQTARKLLGASTIMRHGLELDADMEMGASLKTRGILGAEDAPVKKRGGGMPVTPAPLESMVEHVDGEMVDEAAETITVDPNEVQRFAGMTLSGQMQLSRDAMADLHALLAARGSPSSDQVLRRVQQFERASGLFSGLTKEAQIDDIIMGRVDSVNEVWYKTIMDALTAWPTADIIFKIDAPTREKLARRISDLGLVLDFGKPNAHAIIKGLEAFEKEQQRDASELSVLEIEKLLDGRLAQLHMNRWQNLVDALEHWPQDNIIRPMTRPFAEMMEKKWAAAGEPSMNELADMIATASPPHIIPPFTINTIVFGSAIKYSAGHASAIIRALDSMASRLCAAPDMPGKDAPAIIETTRNQL